MTRRPATAVVAALSLALLAPAAASAAPAAPANLPAQAATALPTATTASLSAEEQELVRLVNASRATEGLRPLVADPDVSAVARAWSAHMAAVQRMYHNPSYSTQIPSGWTRAGENVAMGYRTPAAMHKGWMDSPGHRANIMRPDYTHIGVGWVADSRGTPWGTQVFAGYPAGTRPSPSPDPTQPQPRFSDVPFSHPFHDAVEWGARQGIIAGYRDGTFRPRTTVSREATSAFLYRALTGRSTIPACTGSSRAFRDVPASHPFCGAIEWLAANGYANGYADGTYRPGHRMSRQAMAAFLHRADGSPATSCSGTRFRDVGRDHPFCGEIEWMATTGRSTGYDDRTYRPGRGVARDATAAFLYRAR